MKPNSTCVISQVFHAKSALAMAIQEGDWDMAKHAMEHLEAADTESVVKMQNQLADIKEEADEYLSYTEDDIESQATKQVFLNRMLKKVSKITSKHFTGLSL